MSSTVGQRDRLTTVSRECAMSTYVSFDNSFHVQVAVLFGRRNDKVIHDLIDVNSAIEHERVRGKGGQKYRGKGILSYCALCNAV